MRNDLWFKNAVFYQIYPRSFCDSNGDGIGDIKGIISKLDYLKDLGVNCVWLSPCYKSPNDDIGYDISDYYSINPEYGDMNDFKEMLDGFHKRGMKLIMDLVVNHTSDEHPWFVESKNPESPYRDYYYWRKGKKPGVAPNNWNSNFTGDAWEYDKDTDSYYLHLFTKKQVDLNWENPAVRAEVLKILNFWFDFGVDGFRCDVINYISKKEGLPDDNSLFNPLKGAKYYCNGEKIHQYINFLNEEAFGKREKLFLGECGGTTTQDALDYTARDRHEMDLIFNFEHVMSSTISKYIPLKFKLKNFKKIISRWQNDLMHKGWNSLYLENHDQTRSLNHFGNVGEFRVQSAKLLATMLATLKGSIFIYEGQELGMINHHFDKIEDFSDTATQSVYHLAHDKLHLPRKFLLNCFNQTARDHARTPMQWSADSNGGFSTGSPWMPINADYKTCNVSVETADENSVLNYYKELLKFRKKNNVIIDGDFTEILKNSKKFYVYTRTYEDKNLLVVLNWSDKSNSLPHNSMNGFGNAKYVFGNYSAAPLTAEFKPYEARVYRF
ncbi:MAG: alpha-glucosidase [Clostridia bacterium]